MNLNLEALVELGQAYLDAAGVSLVAQIRNAPDMSQARKPDWLLAIGGTAIPSTPRFRSEEDAAIWFAFHGAGIVVALQKVDQ